jgi:hypothetical protein
MISGFLIFISVIWMIKNLKKWSFHMDLQLLPLLSNKLVVPNCIFAIISYNLQFFCFFLSLQDSLEIEYQLLLCLTGQLHHLIIRNEMKFEIWN